MEPVQFSVLFEYKISGAWVDISTDVRINSVMIGKGIKDSSPSSRMAVPGELKFNLRNDDQNSGGLEGYYTPAHTNCRVGWVKGAEVRVRFFADGISYTKFKGEIRSIQPVGDMVGDDVSVMAEDMLYKLRKKMKLPALARNKTMAEGVALVLENYGISLDGGITIEGTMSQTFATIFDITPKDASGLTETAQLVKSELGFAALNGDLTSGEVLRLQSRSARGAASVVQVPVGNANADQLVDYDDNLLVDYDGNILVETNIQEIDLTDKRKVIQYGDHVINRARVQISPRRENESLQVLFRLDSKPELAPGESMTVIGSYSDPNAEAIEVAAYSMQLPVSGSDYTANTASDESGDDRTSSLEVAPPEYGVKEVENSFQNNHPTDTIFVTLLQNQGYGVSFYRTVEVVSEDISDETYEESFSMEYISDVAEAQLIADAIVAKLKTPRLEVQQLDFDLEQSWANYWGAIFLESGDKIPLVDERFNMDTHAFVQGYTLRGKDGGWDCALILASEEVSTI